jgi:hypothetical protein
MFSWPVRHACPITRTSVGPKQDYGPAGGRVIGVASSCETELNTFSIPLNNAVDAPATVITSNPANKPNSEIEAPLLFFALNLNKCIIDTSQGLSLNRRCVLQRLIGRISVVFATSRRPRWTIFYTFHHKKPLSAHDNAEVICQSAPNSPPTFPQGLGPAAYVVEPRHLLELDLHQSIRAKTCLCSRIGVTAAGDQPEGKRLCEGVLIDLQTFNSSPLTRKASKRPGMC